MEPKVEIVELPCRGGTCDKPGACIVHGNCLYRSSADEAREVMEHQRGVCDRRARGEGCPKGCSPLEPAETIAVTQIVRTALPTDSAARKDIPLARGLLDYFPAALARVAELSRIGNEKHNPGEALHHARGKSGDHADCILRHLTERGTIDTDGLSHSVKVAWRALAMLQEEEEGRGAPKARAAR